LELNRTFYSLVSPRVFRDWYQAAPRGFRWAVKGSRFITHNKKLDGVEEPMANFFSSGVLELKEKLGPILWQLSPTWRLNLERLDEFLRLLPSTTTDAARLARQHTLPNREHSTNADRKRPLRHALELRHPSWFVPEVADLARKHRVALAFSHSKSWPYTDDVTAGFVYLRLHGPGRLYASAYTDAQMRDWAKQVLSWTGNGDVFVYFDNDGEGHAPRQALKLIDLVSRY